MQVQVNIEYEQLLKIVKSLPTGKLRQLKAEINREVNLQKNDKNFEEMLLHGPVATKKQIETIENNRKAINQWRAK